ncbi:MAG: acyl-[acyl-carrier-protein]--UDP-N-acetylglucosamine O-acyltransferase [gamma proteobacterium symbiont of Ctena orbiculata]|uniref:Acyl-[acyl-carrier-protein]--UDP-N-acetylglucosamine O-acyltransferase n=1 Tax=Candidatus Thiodiazotropha taylori TaxID=2792791 RepID=A0A944M6F5_9GAMM|nr:acyl-ACP--UDP-N-acetylglucosamine O-acyltransferase [Candidatus Thiodiazotropha taylori]PUB83666.1 MAG: acyl-[acyl-carrier-protein]--UDP-N-acetylglucosamine O-acyltransferase [gamma proteobacterium symbiont of Ctena orbiculata]MBT2988015.1 acyl-ACP--UDP-N-acetylglucosamine O-acyltransferase [Candidatus Thiodiazotropha taylori]MBT2997660.1 acyl-ACP--UDP-N-acetylglucosamine O-acyltransferase [Candidatus Thiodiazotropha taylori]MBT3001919.1 acyl-ACP--UDP-N-acetylglucosamine O-acyltransferase [C
MSIHPTAIVDAGAELGRNVSVGPYTIIGPDVVIADESWIGPHVVINGPTRIGKENRIYQFASIGEAPQDLKYAGEPTQLEIGDRNTIREYATINRGTVNGGGITRVGDDNLLMAYIHIAHDCTVGNGTVFSNNASLAGHVDIGNQVILSGFTLVHQFCSVGDHAFTGMGSAISKDVPPYLMVSGNPGRSHGINSKGLERRGFSAEAIRAIKRAYKVLCRSGLPLEEAKREIAAMADEVEELALFSRFLGQSRRSIIR